jgi:hypothetical protein
MLPQKLVYSQFCHIGFVGIIYAETHADPTRENGDEPGICFMALSSRVECRFCFFCSAGDQTQCLAHGRQVIYH